MIVTEYKPEYRDQTLQLVKEFESEYFKELGLETNLETFDQAIDEQRDSCFILLIDGKLEGVLSGTIVKGYATTGLTFHEVLWYVRKPYRSPMYGYGIELFNKACESLQARGVKTMITAHLTNDIGKKMGKFYKGLGFNEFETHYIKKLD